LVETGIFPPSDEVEAETLILVLLHAIDIAVLTTRIAIHAKRLGSFGRIGCLLRMYVGVGALGILTTGLFQLDFAWRVWIAKQALSAQRSAIAELHNNTTSDWDVVGAGVIARAELSWNYIVSFDWGHSSLWRCN
jgi:hypothetical protein